MNPTRARRGTSRPSDGGRVAAVLGPTNTGKTHFAIERMLAHRSGMIGLPLRLLAREVYDKIARIKGAKLAALVTGEEKIVPPEARYFVCTVEAMPLDLGVAFLAIDEIQLCADPERGHVFTDRLLQRARRRGDAVPRRGDDARRRSSVSCPRRISSRGRAFPISPIPAPRNSRACPAARPSSRSRRKTFTASPSSCAGSAAARPSCWARLSPRTRNAQVALYQSGEVDFLVATDAIGMGINMDVDHVAFAELDEIRRHGRAPAAPRRNGPDRGPRRPSHE